MHRFFLFTAAFIISCTLLSCGSRKGGILEVAGLRAPVEVIRDKWGINHIYAGNQHDLFFAQGYCAARDRLFQFEIWRRQATGTVAEILGEREVKRDIGARLFRFRGDMEAELNHYHPESEEIIRAYVEGVNTYIDETLKDEDSLPLEFRLLGIKPGKWTPEVVISRHRGLNYNVTQELDIGRAVAKAGPEKVRELAWFHPKDPLLDLDPAIEGDLLKEDILELYKAFREPLEFKPEDIPAAGHRAGVYGNAPAGPRAAGIPASGAGSGAPRPETSWLDIGSNNWVVSGAKTESGHTIMANDPHRALAVPSLRYMVHLNAPGWNVIGGGEPTIPGVSIGHNEYGAWGLTVFITDAEDLYVYDLNPDNLEEYKYQGKWEKMSVLQESIPVKGGEPVQASLRYTRHGPVTYIDTAHLKAYAVRCAWLEPGGAGYLASLRMDQARSWNAFREACKYNHMPGENMVWAGRDGTIGWQATGLAPVRKGFSGLVPVPGNGRYEWDGYLPMLEKPHLSNPEKGFFATANQDVTPENYKHWDAIGYFWVEPYRGDRVNEVLASGETLSVEDMKALQTDYLSIPARRLVPCLEGLEFEDSKYEEARERLLGWDFVLDKNSVPAAVYAAWENKILENAQEEFVPEPVRELISLQLKRVLDWIEAPDGKFGASPEKGRDAFLKRCFEETVAELSARLGGDMNGWKYGQPAFKHVKISHALSPAVNDSLKQILTPPLMPRGGNAYTPGATSSNDNQTHGATFRIIVDTGDWDKTLGTTAPGQAGDPESPFYQNLYEMWAQDQYFPLYYSKDKIEEAAAENYRLSPAQ